jgi:putative Ca2+/H+ antiporter (TMEM165/GDT1 family)
LEPLLFSFVAAGLGEWGDKTQLLVIALAARYGRPLPILAGVLVAALANSLLASFGGALIHDTIVPRAATLLIALALIFAGVAGLIRPRRQASEGKSRAGPFLVAAAAFFVLEFGDKTQFLTFALTVHYDSFLLAAAGATAGIMASSVPAAVLGERLSEAVPLRPIRMTLGALFLAIGIVLALKALELL